MSSRHRIEPGGRSLALVCAVLLSATLLGCTVTPARPLQTPDADALFNQVKTSPPTLRAFLSAMPKGGDLHSHLSGAVYAESYLRWGIEDGLCVDAARLVLLRCDSEGIPLARVCGQDDVTAGPCHRLEDVQRLQTAVDDRTFRGRLVDALSTRNYQVYGRSGHDQFFAAFSAFGAASGRPGEMLAEVMRRAGAQNILYLELMVSPGMAKAARLASDWSWNDDLEAMRRRIGDADLDRIAADVGGVLDDTEHQARTVLGCGSAAPDAGCDVTVRFLAQVIRTRPTTEVFAQIVFAFHLARSSPLVVGVNLVAPEDDPIALADYSRHMRAVGFASHSAPDAGIALHAGELALGLVDPEHLRFHIREAVEVAGARRIEHGTDVMHEDAPYELLATLRQRDVLVEIGLTSSALILGIEGHRHPFPIYRRAGVPVALSTDDEGVSRIDLSHEYHRAVQTYGLTYADVKALSYNGCTTNPW